MSFKKNIKKQGVQGLDVFHDVIDCKSDIHTSKYIQNHIRGLIKESNKIFLIIPFIVEYSSILKTLFESIKTKNNDIKLVVSNYNGINDANLLQKLLALSIKKNSFAFKVFDTNKNKKVLSSNILLFEEENKRKNVVFYRNTSLDLNLHQNEIIDLNVLLSFKKNSSLYKKIENYFFMVWKESIIINEQWIKNYDNRTKIVKKDYSLECVNKDIQLGKVKIVLQKNVNWVDNSSKEEQIQMNRLNDKNTQKQFIKNDESPSNIKTNEEIKKLKNVPTISTPPITLKESDLKILVRIKESLMKNQKKITQRLTKEKTKHIYIIAILCKILNIKPFLFIVEDDSILNKAKEIFHEVYSKEINSQNNTYFDHFEKKNFKSYSIKKTDFITLSLDNRLLPKGYLEDNRYFVTKHDLLKKHREDCKKSRFALIINESFSNDESLSQCFHEDCIVLNLKTMEESNTNTIPSLSSSKPKEDLNNYSKNQIGLKQIPFNTYLVLNYQEKGVLAYGYRKENGSFIILKDSIGSSLLSRIAKKEGYWKKIFTNLSNDKIISLKNKKVTFKNNYLFKSMLEATSFLLGKGMVSSAYFLNLWKVDNASKKIVKNKSLKVANNKDIKMNLLPEENIFLLNNLNRGVLARGYKTKDEGFVILENSIGTLNPATSTKEKPCYKDLMSSLWKHKIITRINNNRFIFLKDYSFINISRATLIVYGYLMSYKLASTKWLNNNGNTYFDVYKKQYSEKTENEDKSFAHNILKLQNYKKKVFARGYENNEGGFIVLKDSIGTLNAVKSTKDTNQYKDRMKYLYKIGAILNINEDRFIFTRDYCFPKGISRATLVLLGTQIGVVEANKKWTK